MLVEKAIKANAIVSLKLVTGEELIAKLIENTESNTSYVRVKRPLTLIMVSTPESNTTYGDNVSETPGEVAFAPWMLGPSDDQIFRLANSSILFMCEARTEAAEQYRTALNDQVLETPASSRGIAESAIPVSRGR